MKRRYFYGPFILAVIVFALLSLPLHADAKLIPAGTEFLIPGDPPQTLTTNAFLLTRADMERATACLAEQEINLRVIADLHTLANNQEQALNTLLPWTITAIIVASVGSFLVGHFFFK
jgi:hypothetical protein